MSLERKIKTRKADLQHGELYANMDSLLKLYKYGNACTITKVFASQQQDADMEANDDIDQVPVLHPSTRHRSMRCFPPYGDWDSPPPGTPETFDHTQHCTYAAVSLRDFRLQLPLVFEHHFERSAHGVWEQKQPLFFAVEGSTQVFKALDAAEQRYYHFHNKNIAIFATATYKEAKARVKK
ncbi:hypothetical protein C8F04DRAFT_1264930 [Mycena alexandri]|uniref:Uncharacterized protein n=1 Tax=Mycena alexandri TaxID=1745969 RepID=A0AAD6SKY0_9AGAR|nr:hypothetical protein C8F04DRAFT_1264930 [Mycena alexandri]